jgi:hypothetical protein
MEYTTLKSFDNSIDAHIFRVELEANGFEVVVVDENIVTTVPFYSNAVGGIKIKVAQDQLEGAIAYLKATAETMKSSIVCPTCNCNDIHVDFKSIRSIKSLLLFIFSAIVSNHGIGSEKVNRCNQCKTEF